LYVGQVPDLPLRDLRLIGQCIPVSFYRRRLPHWHPDKVPIFLPWRLFGSLLKYRLAELDGNLTEGQRFLALDREMDSARSGPTWLKHP
jgi:hypothetical protein